MKLKQSAACLTAGFLLGTGVLSAAPLNGVYTNSFYDSPYLWDISGSYDEDLDGLAVSYSMAVDSSGKLSGSGNAYANMFEGYDVNLDIGLTFNGKVSSAGSVTRVAMTMKMDGAGYIEGYDCVFTATMNEKVEIDPANRQLVGTASGHVTIAIPSMNKKAGASVPRTMVQTDLPEEATGTWDLSLNVATNGTKYVGDGALLLPGGMTLPFTNSGTYSTKTDLSKLALKGVGLNSAMKMSLTACCTNAAFALRTLSGKALGQSVKFSAGH